MYVEGLSRRNENNARKIIIDTSKCAQCHVVCYKSIWHSHIHDCKVVSPLVLVNHGSQRNYNCHVLVRVLPLFTILTDTSMITYDMVYLLSAVYMVSAVYMSICCISVICCIYVHLLYICPSAVYLLSAVYMSICCIYVIR